MGRAKLELAVGFFVLTGLLCVGYLTIYLSQVEWFGTDTYLVHGRFANATGLRKGAAVDIAGVQVGQVDRIVLDPKRYVADVWMKIDNGIQLSDDVIASIKTSGLIGDKYIQISPGASEDLLKNGGLITDTQSAIDIEELISKYVFGSVNKGE